MDVGKSERKLKGRVLKKEAVVGEYEDGDCEQYVEDERKKKAVASGGAGKKCGGGGGCEGGGGEGSGGVRSCQAEKCTVDLTDAKPYHRRHRVCENHAKAQVVVVAGIRQRFCQQCSRFHELSQFDEAKRSCRMRLAGHNERRRKNSVESHVEGSSRKGNGGTQLKDFVCGQVDDKGRIQITIQENATFKHFQIR